VKERGNIKVNTEMREEEGNRHRWRRIERWRYRETKICKDGNYLLWSLN